MEQNSTIHTKKGEKTGRKPCSLTGDLEQRASRRKKPKEVKAVQMVATEGELHRTPSAVSPPHEVCPAPLPACCPFTFLSFLLTQSMSTKPLLSKINHPSTSVLTSFMLPAYKKKCLQEEFLGWVSAVTHTQQHRAPASAQLLHLRLFARKRCIIFKVTQWYRALEVGRTASKL